MNEHPQPKIDLLTYQANKALSASETILNEVINDPSISNVSDNTTINQPQRLQLILQYRLDTQDALTKLLQMHQGLLQLLGITPQQSSKMNLDRLEYALGNDDLHQILSALSQLVHSLSRVAYRYQQSLKKTSPQKQTRPVTKMLKFEVRLQQAVAEQKEFTALIANIHHQLTPLSPKETIKLNLDTLSNLHITTLKWLNTLQNNLKLSHQYYEKMNKTLQLDHQLNDLNQQLEIILKELPPMNQPQHFFNPPQLNTTELEQRATAKRLRPFFNH